MGELSTIQLIIIGIGAVIALPSLIDLLKGFSVPSFSQSGANANISTTVSQWEKLYSSCEKLCLTNACKKLDEVFPLLVDKDENCFQKEDDIEILDD
tara:strand:- start:970 stop:1260 length:291 start_codon:yes stop_codon:yes gene_type:complete